VSPQGGRVDRAQKLAKRVLGELIQDLKDPRIGFATVTSVKISPDLRHGRIFVSVLGSEVEQRDTIAGLTSAAPFLRGQLGRQMRMKYLPELIFELDTLPQEAERLEALLHKVHESETHGPDDSEPDDTLGT
jgi:ribosome-binding factor A